MVYPGIHCCARAIRSDGLKKPAKQKMMSQASLRHHFLFCSRRSGPTRKERASGLTLRILRSLTGALQARLLAFLHARIAREVASLAQAHFEIRVHAHQRPRQSMPDSASLTAGATADYAHSYGIIIAQVKHTKWGRNRCQMRISLPKIGPGGFAIDSDTAIAIGEDAHTSYRRLAPPHTIVILTLDGLSHGRFSSFFVCL